MRSSARKLPWYRYRKDQLTDMYQHGMQILEATKALMQRNQDARSEERDLRTTSENTA